MPEVKDELFTIAIQTENESIWTPQITHSNGKDDPYPFRM